MSNELRYAPKYRQSIIDGLNRSEAFFADSLGFVYFRNPPGNWPTYFGNKTSMASRRVSSDQPIHLVRLCEDHAERRDEGKQIVDELYPALDFLMRRLVKEAKSASPP